MGAAGDGLPLIVAALLSGVVAVAVWAWLLVDSRRRQMAGDAAIVIATAALVPAVLAGAVAGLRQVPQGTPLLGALGDTVRTLAEENDVTTAVVTLLGLFSGVASVANVIWYVRRRSPALVAATGGDAGGTQISWHPDTNALTPGAATAWAPPPERTFEPLSGRAMPHPYPPPAQPMPQAPPPPPEVHFGAPSYAAVPPGNAEQPPVSPSTPPMAQGTIGDNGPADRVHSDEPTAGSHATRSFFAPSSSPGTMRLSASPAEPRAAAWLVYLNGPRVGMEIVLGSLADQEGVMIGRDAHRCQVVLPDDSVSQLHARILRAGSAFTIIDMGATNPVLVNGERVERGPLRDLDQVTLGEGEFVFLAVELGIEQGHGRS